MVIEANPHHERWTTQSIRFPERFDAWQAKLNDSHLCWSLERKHRGDYLGKLEVGVVRDLKIVRCICDPCNGIRQNREISIDNTAYYGLLFILSGYECVESRNISSVLSPGSFYLWDSTEKIRFNLNSPIHKITLFVPQKRMKSSLPHVDQFVGQAIDWKHGMGAAIRSLISSIGSNTGQMDEREEIIATETTLELITANLWNQYPKFETKPKSDLLIRVKSHIETNLADSNLTPTKLANHFGISTRYLHSLFYEEQFSVSRWIMERRLERCRKELICFGNTKSITEIAYRWGFNDSAHFSRSFKNRYGSSPKEYRDQNTF